MFEHPIAEDKVEGLVVVGKPARAIEHRGVVQVPVLKDDGVEITTGKSPNPATKPC